MFHKVLVANRGEIALRVIAACRDLGLRTVVAYSEADRHSLPVRLADERVCIGPAAPRDSYLDVPRVLTAAEISGADAIHPGYGFLAESRALAEVCEACQVSFIGPPSASIRMMGDKALARKVMREAGVPILPGTEEPVSAAEEAARIAGEVGYPVLFKASFGGGGRGMRIVTEESGLAPALAQAASEAQAAFGDAEGVTSSATCRAPAMSRSRSSPTGHDPYRRPRRARLLGAAPPPESGGGGAGARSRPGDPGENWVKRRCGAAEAVGYRNAGTVEFLMDPEGRFFFSEMNARIQVEHPVTEMVTGLDLVREQIRVAAGEPLSFGPAPVRGAAIECRINAEDPERFTPSPGTITGFHAPGGPGVRVGHGRRTPERSSRRTTTRWWPRSSRTGRIGGHAVARMRRALAEMVVEGIRTSLPLHRRILESEEFPCRRFSTPVFSIGSAEAESRRAARFFGSPLYPIVDAGVFGDADPGPILRAPRRRRGPGSPSFAARTCPPASCSPGSWRAFARSRGAISG